MRDFFAGGRFARVRRSCGGGDFASAGVGGGVGGAAGGWVGGGCGYRGLCGAVCGGAAYDRGRWRLFCVGEDGDGGGAGGFEWERVLCAGGGFLWRWARGEGGEVLAETSPLTVTVPGAVDAWWQLHSRFGRLPWRGLFQTGDSVCGGGVSGDAEGGGGLAGGVRAGGFG